MEINIAKLQKDIQTGAPIRQMRKNHALEHATIHMLEKSSPNRSFAGYSIHKGFWILGKGTIQEIQEAVDLAAARMKNGQTELAIHPNCGTNLAVTGLLTSLGALLTFAGTKNDEERLERLSTLALVTALTVQFSKPLGLKTQAAITTDADIRDLAIIGIDTGEIRGMPYFFVKTRLTE